MPDNNITKFLRAILVRVQNFEDTVQSLLLQRSLPYAVGKQLDLLGKLVGQPRNGLVDADYRRYIAARIVANNSDGLVENVIKVIRLVLNDSNVHIHAMNNGFATMTVRLEEAAVSIALATIIIDFLRYATAAGGVRIILESSPDDPGDWFEWDETGKGWDDGNFVYAED